MTNILILNFGNHQDIIASAHYIGSLLNEHPNTEVTFATYTKNAELTETIQGIKSTCYINQQKISTLTTSPVYSDAFAINTFSSCITPLTDKKWDKVINFSNDSFSTYLISGLDTKLKLGSFIDKNGVARTPGAWEIYQNYVAAKIDMALISRAEIRGSISQAPIYFEVEKFKINSDFALMANQNFARIRQMKPHSNNRIIGISLTAGDDGYLPSIQQYQELIEVLLDSEEYMPVILLTGDAYQIEMTNKLNKEFNNSLISINVSTVALTPVLNNLDILLSQSSIHLGVADAMDVRCIEIRDFHAKIKTPVTITPDNYIIYNNFDQELVSDIVLSINEEFETQLPISVMNNKNKTYKSLKDDYGVFYTQLRGQIDLHQELNYHIGRCHMYEVLGYPRNNELLENIGQSISSSDLAMFITDTKDELTDSVRHLLSSLRSVRSAISSKENLSSFLDHLDILMQAGQRDSIIGSSIRFFEGRIENISSTDPDSNLKEIEINLFLLKKDLQLITGIFEAMTKSSTTEVHKNL